MAYKVEKKGSFYVVTNSEGRVANDFKHKTKEQADIHCRNLNAYFGAGDK